jgi:hypothetical protein
MEEEAAGVIIVFIISIAGRKMMVRRRCEISFVPFARSCWCCTENNNNNNNKKEELTRAMRTTAREEQRARSKSSWRRTFAEVFLVVRRRRLSFYVLRCIVSLSLSFSLVFKNTHFRRIENLSLSL